VVDTPVVGSYDDYCPIAIGIEVIGDRWTPLILRELMIGSERFNDIHRGIPRISRSLLSHRLRMLERQGLVERHPRPGAQAVDYRLTAAGADLQPVLWDLGRWATRWVFTEPEEAQMDTIHLVWRLHQCVDPDALPPGRTTVEFLTTGAGSARCWLVFEDRESTACQIDPGYPVDVLVRGETRELLRWFLGRISWSQARASGGIAIAGPAALTRRFPHWFHPSAFAAEVGAAARRESRLSTSSKP